MPSVASEPNAVLPSRPYQPSVRSQQADAPPASPFAELLDSATAPSEPPAARPVQSDRADGSKPADSAKSDAAPVKSETGAANTAAESAASAPAPDDAGEASPPVDEKAAAEAIEVKLATAVTEQAVKAEGETQPDGDQAVDVDTDTDVADPEIAVPVPTVAIAQPVATTIAVPIAPAPQAAPAEGAAETDALAAFQVAGQPAATGKPGPAQGDNKEKSQAGRAAVAQPQTKSAAPAPSQDVPAIAPQSEDAETFDLPTVLTQATPHKDAPVNTDTEDLAEHVRQAPAALAKTDLSPVEAPVDATVAPRASADSVQNLGIVPSHSTNAAAPAAAPAPIAQAAPAPAVPVAGLAFEIVTQSRAGKNSFEIRLDPPELGRIDVRLHVDRDGNVSSRLVVDRADTLDLLKRDAQGLERALQQAGLKTSDNALQFSLRQQHTFTRDDTPAHTAQLVIPDDDAAAIEALRQGYGRLLGQGGGLDIRV